MEHAAQSYRRRTANDVLQEAVEATVGKKPRLGSGGRFAAFVKKLLADGYTKARARAIAASRGIQKHGKAKMRAWAAAGKRRAKRARAA